MFLSLTLTLSLSLCLSPVNTLMKWFDTKTLPLECAKPQALLRIFWGESDPVSLEFPLQRPKKYPPLPPMHPSHIYIFHELPLNTFDPVTEC